MFTFEMTLNFKMIERGTYKMLEYQKGWLSDS